MTEELEKLDQAISLKVEGNYNDAVPLLQDVLASNPGSPEGHRQLGLIYGFMGLFDESLEELVVATGLAPDNTDILCDLAMTHAMLGMFDEAKAEFEKVLESDPDNKQARQQMTYFGDLAAAG